MPSARTSTSVCAAILCLGVSWIHIQDQGGFPGDKTPAYVGVGYYLLEAAGVVCAALLVSRRTRSIGATWLLAAGVALGPLLGYILSRGPGLPDYSDDKGNWTEPLGLLSLAVEVVLLLLAAFAMSARRAAVAQTPAPVDTVERAPSTRSR